MHMSWALNQIILMLKLVILNDIYSVINVIYDFAKLKNCNYCCNIRKKTPRLNLYVGYMGNRYPLFVKLTDQLLPKMVSYILSDW